MKLRRRRGTTAPTFDGVGIGGRVESVDEGAGTLVFEVGASEGGREIEGGEKEVHQQV